MHIVALIRDGNGRLMVSATRAPDLLRRQISASTGSAELVWCGVPPVGEGAKAIVSGIVDRFGVDADGAIKSSPKKVIKALVSATGKPVSHGRPWRWFRRRVGYVMTTISSLKCSTE